MNKALRLVAALGVLALAPACGTKADQLGPSSVALKTSGRVSAGPSTSPSSTPKPPPFYAEQLHATLGVSGSALRAGHVQLVLSNVSPRPCWLGGVLPVSGLRCLPRSALYDKLAIGVREGELQMLYPQDLGNGRLEGESAAGPIPTPA